jgi:hypothetical protein
MYQTKRPCHRPCRPAGTLFGGLTPSFIAATNLPPAALASVAPDEMREALDQELADVAQEHGGWGWDDTLFGTYFSPWLCWLTGSQSAYCSG